MKPQDILFFIILVPLFFTRNSKFFVIAGVVSVLASIPLFASWIFFTAERFTWYAAAFFLCAVIFSFFRVK